MTTRISPSGRPGTLRAGVALGALMLVGFTACSDDSNDVDNNLDDTTDMTVTDMGTGEGSQVDGDSDSGVIVLDTTVAPGSPDSSPPPNSNAGAGGGDGNGSVTP